MTWQEAVMGATAFATTTAIVVVVIVQVAATWRARMSVAREEAYQRLAAEATEAQRRNAELLGTAVAELAELRSRTAALEKLLKEVEEPWQR